MVKNGIEKKSVREVFAGEEIALTDLFDLFRRRRKILFISTSIFLIIGILVASTSPLEYEAEAQILSEEGGTQNTTLGGLAGLAGLAGIALPQGSNQTLALSPDMYPTIASSQPFLMNLMEERFYFQEKNREMTLFEYFSEERSGHIFTKSFNFLRSIPARFFALFERKKEWKIPERIRSQTDSIDVAKPRIISLTHEQRYVMGQLEPRIDIEAKGKIITVKVKMPEPYLSAELNTVVLKNVIDYVTRYKTEKQKNNLSFIEDRTKEAEEKFKQSQLRLAIFKDSNQGVVTQTALTREEQLQAELNLAFNLYNTLAQELEQTRIRLKKETPLFTEFEPVTVPLQKAEPNIPKTILLYTGLGIVLGFLVVVLSIASAYRKNLLL